jgi:hypothetical protein
MTRREHEIRREIADKLQARIAEDPFFRLYELGIEAGRLMAQPDDNKAELERNIAEAREVMVLCYRKTSIVPPPDINSVF